MIRKGQVASAQANDMRARTDLIVSVHYCCLTSALIRSPTDQPRGLQQNPIDFLNEWTDHNCRIHSI
jgi:hypothetical protein